MGFKNTFLFSARKKIKRTKQHDAHGGAGGIREQGQKQDKVLKREENMKNKTRTSDAHGAALVFRNKAKRRLTH